MKTKNMKKVSGLVALSALMTASSIVSANDANYLNSDPININGYVQEEAPVTDQELETVKNELKKQKNAIIINKQKSKKYQQLSRSTEKLADTTEEMIEERKESQVAIDKYNKKIDCLMNPQKEGCEEYADNKADEVSLKQAAPKQVVEQAVEIKSDSEELSAIKLIPNTGFKTYVSENEQLEAGLSVGMNVETEINSRFAIGTGLNYTSLKTEDFGGNNYVNSGYQNYYNTFYNGREIDYSNINVDLYSKFYLLRNNRFKLYAGAGLAYNRSTMKYTNNDQANSVYNGQYYGYNFGSEEVTTSSMSASLMAGSEIAFNKMFGLNVEAKYTKGIGNLSSNSGVNSYNSPDQQRLEDFSDELSEAHILNFNAGLFVKF